MLGSSDLHILSLLKLRHLRGHDGDHPRVQPILTAVMPANAGSRRLFGPAAGLAGLLVVYQWSVWPGMSTAGILHCWRWVRGSIIRRASARTQGHPCPCSVPSPARVRSSSSRSPRPECRLPRSLHCGWAVSPVGRPRCSGSIRSPRHLVNVTSLFYSGAGGDRDRRTSWLRWQPPRLAQLMGMGLINVVA